MKLHVHVIQLSNHFFIESDIEKAYTFSLVLQGNSNNFLALALYFKASLCLDIIYKIKGFELYNFFMYLKSKSSAKILAIVSLTAQIALKII